MSCFQSVRSFPVRFRKSLLNSSKSYRLIQLPNGVLTILISDPSGSLASCAACVCSGSHNDPDEVLGLAHLCEHMLFLGTKQFPGPNQFLEFIDSNCGQSNAYTTGEQTVFYFELPVNDKLHKDEPIFNHALQMFSRFFKAPLFNETLIKNEVCIIQGEHNQNLADTKKIMYHAFKILANNRHPFHRFATGNVHTIREIPKLKHINVRSQLTRYFNQNFHGENLTVALKGPQLLNYLQKLAILSFGDIKECPKEYSLESDRGKSRSQSRPECKSESIPGMNILEDNYLTKYDNQSLFPNGKMILIKGDSGSTLRLFFPIEKPNMIDHLSFFENCWCNILGDESHGSLCDLLIKQYGFASSIFVFGQTLTLNDRVLCVDMDLTRKGLRNFENLVYLTLKTVQLLLLEPTEKLAKYLSQQLTISKLNYYFRNSTASCSDEVSQLAEILQSNIHRLCPENITKGDRDLDFADPEYKGDYCEANRVYWEGVALEFMQLSKIVLSFTQLNVVVVCPHPEFYLTFMQTNSLPNNNVPQEYTVDDHYNILYKVVTLNTMRLIKEIVRSNQAPPQVLYATQHPFLTQTQLELNSLMDYTDEINLHFLTKKFSSLKPPYLISHDKSHETWYKKEFDLVFKSRVAISFLCQSLETQNTPFTMIGMELICRLLGSELRHKLYPAEMIGCSWAIYPNYNGVPSIGINVCGLTKDISTIVKMISDEIQAFMESGIANTSYSECARVRVQMRNSYLEMKKAHGIKQALALSQLVLEESVFSLDDRIGALELIDLSDLVDIGQHVLRDTCYSRTLVTGDVDMGSAEKLAKLLPFPFPDSGVDRDVDTATAAADMTEPSSYLLNRGRNYVYKLTNANNSDPLNTIFYYMQFGMRDDPHARALGKLVSYFIGLHARYELRTRKQLGYTILSSIRYSRATVGMCICVLSGTYSGEQLHKEIEVFLFELELTLMRYLEQEFKAKVTEEFIKSYDPSQNEEMTSNFMFATLPIQSSTNFDEENQVLVTHKSYWESIVNKTYRFNSKQGNEEISVAIVSKVTHAEFLTFFRNFVSIKSTSKASLAILVNTGMNEEEIVSDAVKRQLKSYMDEHGIDYDEPEVDMIIRNCNSNQGNIQKEVAKYIKSKVSGLKYVFSSLMAISAPASKAKKWDPDGNTREQFDLKRVAAKYGQQYLNTATVLSQDQISDLHEIHHENTIVGKLLFTPLADVLYHYSVQQQLNDERG